jgi:Yip1 domain
MADEILVPEPSQGLSQFERVVDTFVAPSATFADIRRSASWWLPFLLSVLAALTFAYTIDRKVGFDQVAETQIHLSPSQEQQLSSLTPGDRAAQMQKAGIITRYVTYGYPITLLAISAFASLILWATFNFGLGARTTYGQIFCLWMFANLPRLFTSLIAIITLAFGNSPETFNIREPVGTNIGYYLPDIFPWLRALLSFADIIGLWVLVLLIVGGSIVAKVKIGQAAAVVIGWWLLIVLVGVASAAAFS